MNRRRSHGPGGPLQAFGLKLVVLTAAAYSSSLSQESWSVNASLSYNTGTYTYDQTINSYYLNLGLRYRAPRWVISAYVPFILQKANRSTQTPAPGDPFSNHRGMMDNGMSSGSMSEGGIGDVYLYGEFLLLAREAEIPSISLAGQVKAPTSSTLTLTSTGEFDYGIGFTVRKLFGTFSGFADLGYLVLGDPAEIHYKDPLSYGLGFGKFFSGGKYSVSLYYKGYSQILDGIEPPGQLSLGFFVTLNSSTFLSVYAIKGLSESSPYIAFSAGINLGL